VAQGGDATLAIGWVVDDGCPPKRGEGGAATFARSLSDGAPPEGHRADCPTCKLLDEDLACVGVVESRLSAAAEDWLAGRLPEHIESLPGMLLRKNLGESGVTGATFAALRKRGFCEAPGPFSRHWGPFFRRVTVTTDQVLEELFCAGDVQPAHALGVLVHVGGIQIGRGQINSISDGGKLAHLMANLADREPMTLPALSLRDDDESGVRQLKRYLRALYAAFVLDCEVKVFTPD